MSNTSWVKALLVAMVFMSISANAAGQQSDPRNIDDEFLRIANEEIPGFAGYFIDRDGELTMVLKGLQGRDQAAARLEAILHDRRFSTRGRGPTQAIRVVSGEFDFTELTAARNAVARHVFTPGSGAILLDIDEVRNRVVVGVENTESRSAVLERLDTLAIPRGIVEVEIEGPIILPTARNRIAPVGHQATLKHRFRPTIAGIGMDVCTLGVNVRYEGRRGFFTASHCTDVLAAFDGRAFFQPARVSADSLGAEATDPPAFRAGSSRCEQYADGLPCRHSDVAFIRYSPNATDSVGVIGRTHYGSNVINSSTPRFYISGTWYFPTGGEILSKVGRETGWSDGRVERTCVDRVAELHGKRVRMLCQDVADGDVEMQDGESGSPVFAWTTGSDVTLYGILWALSLDRRSFYFSAIANIEDDFGAVTYR